VVTSGESTRLPTKLGVKIVHGKVELKTHEIPDLDEAKRLWMAGKSAQYIFEQAKKKKKNKAA
jgi:hypothetical protein